MRLTRLHIDAALAPGARLALPEAAATHLVRVLRAGVGDPCVLFNGDGHDYAARIVAVGKRVLEVEVIDRRVADTESPLRIVLVQALARGEKMDWIVQKATELGVAAIVPVSSEHAELRLDGARSDKRLAHWQAVAAAACGQCGRAVLPAVSAPLPLSEALPGLETTDARLLLDPQSARGLRDAVRQARCIALAVGPEGGWSARDLEGLQAAGFSAVRFGPRVLRTETAGPAAIAALQVLAGDLG